MIRRFIYFMAITTVLFTSCKKYLETDSPSTFSNDYVFSHEYDIFNAVKGVYALLTQDAGYSTRLSFYNTVNSDVEIITGASDGGRRDIAEFTCNTSNSEVLNPWNNCYQAINRANECIKGIKNSPLYTTNANVKQMYGESIALRAQMYYELVRNWGDVPFKITPTIAGDNFYLPRTDRDTILTSIINDLITVEPDMYYADQMPEGIERMNRGFVQGLIARIALARGGYSLRSNATTPMAMKRNETDYLKYYQIANKYCKMLVASNKHTLSASFKTIFLNECNFITPKNSDVLYEIAFPATYSSDLGYYNGIKMLAGTHPYGSASGSVAFPPTYFYSFDTTDTRLPVTCALYSLDGTLKQVVVNPAGGITTGKWCKAFMATPQGAASTKYTGINWPIMRYSDVLLMLAETENEINNGPTDVAKNALIQVRQRAFPAAFWDSKVTQYVNTASASKASFFTAIVNERAWEFGGECLRKFDLIRWNLYGKTIAATRTKLIQMGLDTRLGTGLGAYATYPDKVYWKTNVDGITLSYANLYNKLTVAPAGYTTANWLLNLANADGTAPSFITDMYNGYTDNTGTAPVRYILPIHQSVIAASLGNLQNYYNY
jgi:hypothetical protein